MLSVMRFICPHCKRILRWEIHESHAQDVFVRLKMKCLCGYAITLPVVEDAPCVGVTTKEPN